MCRVDGLPGHVAPGHVALVGSADGGPARETGGQPERPPACFVLPTPPSARFQLPLGSD